MLSEDGSFEINVVGPTSGSGGPSMLFPICDSGQDLEITGKVSARKLMKLRDRQLGRCALSGVELTPQTISIDHITPVSDGGTDDMGNIQLIHSSINSMKGTMPNSEFVQWCRLVAGHDRQIQPSRPSQ